MVIAVNTRLLLKDRLEGIGWFTYEILGRMVRSHPEHQFVFIFDRPYDPGFIFGPNVVPKILFPPSRHPFLWVWWFEWSMPRLLREVGADIFVSTDGYLSLCTDIPQLLVMHDINFVHRPGDLPWLTSRYYNHYFPAFAKKASKLVTVSGFSADDISRSFGLERDHVSVVYNGVNSDFAPIPVEEADQVRMKYTKGKPFFLFVGALHPRKNIDGLLKAFDRFRFEHGPEVNMVIAGGQMFKTGPIHEVYNHMQFRDEVIFTGRVSSDELKKLMASAMALTFVPHFEGFGIPVIEAMSAGTPVICSNTTSLPEVGGEAVLYVNPKDIGDIASAMQRISSDAQLRNQLRESGFRQKEKFNWDTSAVQLWKSLEGLMASVGSNKTKGHGQPASKE